MAAPLETIIAPFVGESVTPVPYEQPGAVGVPPVRVTVGLKGGTKTFNTSYSYTSSTKLGAVHKESPTNSNAIQDSMGSHSSKYTRTSHTVRIKGGAQNQFYADVEVLDAISFILPNGQHVGYKLANVIPGITDNTGDGNGIEATNVSTRASHMVRVGGTADPTQFFDAEVCDAFVLIGPDASEHAIVSPSGNIIRAIIDNTGSGLGAAATPNSTRAQHVVKLIDQVETTAVGSNITTLTQNPARFLLAVLTDAMAFSGPPLGLPYVVEKPHKEPDPSVPPWYQENALLFPNLDTMFKGALSPGATTYDTTKYTVDAAGQQVPPSNYDPNIYVFFPQDSQGPFIGAGNGIDMGPLWWIRRVGETTQKYPGVAGTYDITYTLTMFTGTGSIGNPAVTAQLISDGDPVKQDIQTLPMSDDATTITLSLNGVTGGVALYLYNGVADNFSAVEDFQPGAGQTYAAWGSFTATQYGLAGGTVIISSPVSPTVGVITDVPEDVTGDNGDGSLWQLMSPGTEPYDIGPTNYARAIIQISPNFDGVGGAAMTTYTGWDYVPLPVPS